LNGLRHANDILGETIFRDEDWRVIGEYVYDGEGGRHQAFYAPIRDTVVMGQVIRPHERIQVEQSLKYSREETQRLWDLAGMVETGQWKQAQEYGKSSFSFYVARVQKVREIGFCFGRAELCPLVVRFLWGGGPPHSLFFCSTRPSWGFPPH
jgi:hypothetical protein